MENRGMAPLILWEWVINAAPRPLYFPGKNRGAGVKGRSERMRRGQIFLHPIGIRTQNRPLCTNRCTGWEIGALLAKDKMVKELEAWPGTYVLVVPRSKCLAPTVPHVVATQFVPVNYEGWNFHSGNYLFTTDT